MPNEMKEVKDVNPLKEKLASLANDLTLVKNIITIKPDNENEMFVYFIDDKDRCMCLPFSVIENFVNKHKIKEQKGIMVV
jgi:hypothetical protein